MLTATRRPSPAAMDSRQARTWRQASISTQRPSSTIWPDSSAIGMNAPGMTQAVLRVIPAHQRLDAEQLALGEVDDRLVLEEELVALRARG